MLIYKSYGGMDSFGEFVTLTASVSFGNMGFSSTVCAKMPIDWQHDESVTLHAQCQGSTTISDVLSSGMMLDTEFPGGNMDAVLDCYYDIESDPENWTLEMRQFRKYNFETLFLNECRGKQQCSVTVPFEDFARVPPSSQRLNMLLFAQVACTQSEEALVMKNQWGLAAACIGLFMCLIFTSFVRKMLHEDKINDKLLDLRLVTVDDYTTQTLLNPKIYADFVKTLPNKDDPKAVPVMEFKKSMAEKITS